VSAEAEASFRQEVTSESPPSCADSLSPDGPAARLLDGSAFHVKLRLRVGVQPQVRRPYRIPESYRPEMEKTIAKLLEFKLIEPSFSQYSNPVFLVHKPSLRDGSPGGLRFVWDGRSVNRAIQTESFHSFSFQPFTSTNILEYQDAQGVLKRAFGTAACCIDDTCALSFGTRAEHEILLLHVLKRMDAHNLRMQPSRCEFLHP
jgi:hypothetical protein